MDLQDVKSLLESGNIDGARESLLKIVSGRPKDARPWLLLSGIAIRSEDWVLGIFSFGELVELRPQDHFSSSGLVHCLFEEKRYEEAISEIDRFLGNLPQTDAGDHPALIEHKETRSRIETLMNNEGR